MGKQTYIINFDGVPGAHSYEALAEDWGNVEGLAMYSADDSLRCDRLMIAKVETGEVREYTRDKVGIWYRCE